MEEEDAEVGGVAGDVMDAVGAKTVREVVAAAVALAVALVVALVVWRATPGPVRGTRKAD